MSDEQTVVRTEVVIDGEPVLLAPDEDVGDLKRRFEAATATSGVFVDLRVAGGRSLSVLVTPHTRVAITVSTIPVESADADDGDQSYAGLFEFSNDLG